MWGDVAVLSFPPLRLASRTSGPAGLTGSLGQCLGTGRGGEPCLERVECQAAGDLKIKSLLPALQLVWARVSQERGDLAQRNSGLAQQQDQSRLR